MAVSFTFFTIPITRYPGPRGFSWNFSLQKREQVGKRRRVAIVIVSFEQFQVKQAEISGKASKSGRTQACDTRE